MDERLDNQLCHMTSRVFPKQDVRGMALIRVTNTLNAIAAGKKLHML